jgi:hypothetical protein
MDFAVFIPIVALCIAVAGIIFHGLEKVARLRVEEAKAKAGQLDGPAAGPPVIGVKSVARRDGDGARPGRRDRWP